MNLAGSQNPTQGNQGKRSRNCGWHLATMVKNVHDKVRDIPWKITKKSNGKIQEELWGTGDLWDKNTSHNLYGISD